MHHTQIRCMDPYTADDFSLSVGDGTPLTDLPNQFPGKSRFSADKWDDYGAFFKSKAYTEFECDLCRFYPSSVNVFGKPCSNNYPKRINIYPVLPMVKRMFKTNCNIKNEDINLCTTVVYSRPGEAIQAQLEGQLGVMYGFSPRINNMVKKYGSALDDKCKTKEVANVPSSTPLAHCGFLDNGVLSVNNDATVTPSQKESLTIYQEIGNSLGLIGGGTVRYAQQIVFTAPGDSTQAVSTIEKRICLQRSNVNDMNGHSKYFRTYSNDLGSFTWFSKPDYSDTCDARVYI